MILTLKQTEALDYLEDDTTEDLLYGGAAGGAKSVLGCYWQLKRRFQYPGSRGFIGRAVFKTLKDTTLKTFFEVAQMQGLKRGQHFDLTGAHDKENPNCILFANGSMIYLRDLATSPSDPDHDELGSLEITDAFIDECGQISQKAKDTLKTRLRYGLNRWNLIPKILFSSNPVKGWPYSEYYKPHRDGLLPPYRKFLQAFVTDNPHAPAAYVQLLQRLPNGPQKQRLLFGNWSYDDDPATLIIYDRILDIFTNDFPALSGTKSITADIARLGSDKIVVGDWEGWRTKLHMFEKQRLTETHKFIDDLRKNNSIPLSRVVVDEDGVGGGIVDYLGCEGFVNNSRPLPNPITFEEENYRSLKDQCYFRLAKRVNEGGLYVSCDDPDIREKIIEELEWVKQYNMDKDGKKQVMPKDKIKEAIGRSPDFADCFIAGTLVWTSKGQIAIEKIKEGDIVITPYGNRKVLSLIQKQSDTLQVINGTIACTGNHRFITNKGLIRSDKLMVNDYICRISIRDLWTHRLKRLLFITGKNIGFLQQTLSIIMPMFTNLENEQKLDFINKFTSTTREKFPKDTMYTTLTKTLLTTILITWNRLRNLCIEATTKKSECQTRISREQQLRRLGIRQARLQSGTEAMRGENGIELMVQDHGNRQNHLKESVLTAANNILQRRVPIAPITVSKKNGIKIKSGSKKEFVNTVQPPFPFVKERNQKRVVENVQVKLPEEITVYTFKVDQDNVYYANGILVENCLMMREYFELFPERIITTF